MPQDDPYAKYQTPAASSDGGDPYAKYQTPAETGKGAATAAAPAKQPSAGRVLIEPVSKTDKDYLTYTGPAGVVGATKHGITNIAKSTYDAGKQALGGMYETGKDIAQNPDRPLVIPDTEGKYKGQPTIYEKYVQPAVHDIGQRFEQIPAGLRELKKEPDPVMSYIRNAEPTVDTAAGQAILAAATEAAPKVAPAIVRGAGRVIKNPIISHVAAPAAVTAAGHALGLPLGTAAEVGVGSGLLGEAASVPSAIKNIGERMSKVGLSDMERAGAAEPGLMSPQETVPSGGRPSIGAPTTPKERIPYGSAEPTPSIAETAAETKPNIGKVTGKEVKTQLERGLGVKEPEPVPSIPEGNVVARADSHVQSWKYDPETRELSVQARRDGVVHHYGDVSPEQAKAFEEHPSMNVKNAPGVTHTAKSRFEGGKWVRTAMKGERE